MKNFQKNSNKKKTLKNIGKGTIFIIFVAIILSPFLKTKFAKRLIIPIEITENKLEKITTIKKVKDVKFKVFLVSYLALSGSCISVSLIFLFIKLLGR